MSAYYYSFDATGARSVDRILSAVACAGKAFHGTEEWTTECEAYISDTKGNSCVEWIQNAANEAAAEHRAALLRFGERVKEALARMLEDDGRVKPASEVRAFDVAALFLKVAP